MTEPNVRMEVGYPTDDTIELEGENPVEVCLWPLYFYRNDEGEPLLAVEIAVEREEDEDGLLHLYTISALDEPFEDRLATVLTLAEVESASDEIPEWIEEKDLRAIQQLSSEEQDLYLMIADLIDYAEVALEEQLLEPGTVIRHSDLPENADYKLED
jgi:hypothetical protein